MLGAAAVGVYLLTRPKLVRSFTAGDISVRVFDDGTARVTSPRADATYVHRTQQLVTLHAGTPSAAASDLLSVGE